MLLALVLVLAGIPGGAADPHIEAFTAALLARRPNLASQENAALLSDISAAFRDYAERMGSSQPVDSAQNADGHRAPGSDQLL